MQYQNLGKSDLKISRIGFGCMSLSPETTDTDLLIGRAIEIGINYFDTADLYNRGKNEEWVGKALKNKRNEVVIGTKVGNKLRADGSGWDWYPKAEYILQAVEASLKRLQTDYIDLYQLHGGTMEDDQEEIVATFESLVKQGKIRYYGISSIRPAVIEAYANTSNIVSVMTQYSMLDRRAEQGPLDLLHEKGIGVLARGVLGKGLLAGKDAFEYNDLSEEQVRAIQQEQKSKFPDMPLHESAIKFVFQHPAVASAIIGIRTPEQLEVYRDFH